MGHTSILNNLASVGIVGLGYVGLPLAVAFGGVRPTVGFDIDQKKLNAYRSGLDPNREVSSEKLAAAVQLRFTNDPCDLADVSVLIVAVPTPVDHAKRPDLTSLQKASRAIGPYLKPGVIVVFESTVFPGCTEEICVPILEKGSGLAWLGRDDASTDTNGVGFHVGYSPERVNPGDQVHRLESVTKVVAGDTQSTLDALSELYGSIVKAGVYRAPSIRVAEAAKVIENTQRDLNIALMNELAMIFNRLNIDTLEVLEAAETKWNFLPFRPGLVGGHCIGVDPYYLTYKAQSTGYNPEIVLAGRRINDGMGKYIAEQTVKQLAARRQPIAGAKVSILGLTFKENCPDLRNSRVPDVVKELVEYGCDVLIHDPIADKNEVEKFGASLSSMESLGSANAVILAVPHDAYLAMEIGQFRKLVLENGILIDVKGALDRKLAEQESLYLWRL